MRNEAKERKPYEYRWYDFLPYVGAATFYHRFVRGEMRGEIQGLKEKIESRINTVTISAYQVVSIDLINKSIFGKSFLEELIKDLW